MLQDSLADALSKLKNADRLGKSDCVVRSTKLVKQVLEIMRDQGYIGSLEFVEDGKSGKLLVELKGKVIDCNVVKPRASVQIDKFEKFEKRYLPGREFGILLLSTSKGVMDHKKAREQKIGGKILAFCY